MEYKNTGNPLFAPDVHRLCDGEDVRPVLVLVFVVVAVVLLRKKTRNFAKHFKLQNYLSNPAPRRPAAAG